jgi:hypothetical protein
MSSKNPGKPNLGKGRAREIMYILRVSVIFSSPTVAE